MHIPSIHTNMYMYIWIMYHVMCTSFDRLQTKTHDSVHCASRLPTGKEVNICTRTCTFIKTIRPIALLPNFINRSLRTSVASSWTFMPYCVLWALDQCTLHVHDCPLSLSLALVHGKSWVLIGSIGAASLPILRSYYKQSTFLMHYRHNSHEYTIRYGASGAIAL